MLTFWTPSREMFAHALALRIRRYSSRVVYPLNNPKVLHKLYLTTPIAFCARLGISGFRVLLGKGAHEANWIYSFDNFFITFAS